MRFRLRKPNKVKFALFTTDEMWSDQVSFESMVTPRYLAECTLLIEELSRV